MAAVEVTISGMLYDKLNRTTQNVVLIGEATLTGVGIGGGPMPGGPGQPPNWGPGGPPHPAFPIAGPGPFPPGSGYPPVVGGGPIIPGGPPLGTWGGDAPWPGYATPPIFIPPNVPPGVTPPTPPNPGDPTTIVPPPAGSAGWPVQPIAVPPYMVVWYPGIGPVVIAPPLTAQPKA